MAGDNILLVAKEDGHSVQTMLATYAAWIEGANAADVEQIKLAQYSSPEPTYPAATHDRVKPPCGPPESPEFASSLPVERQWGRLSWRKYKAGQGVSTKNDWRSGRDSNPRPPA